MNDKCQTDGRGRHNTITLWITRLPEIFALLKIRCFPTTYLEALLISMSSKSQWNKKVTSSKKALEDNMTPTVNICVKIKIQTTVTMFYVLISYHLLGCINHCINWSSRSKTFKYDSRFRGIYLLLLSDVLNPFIQMKYLLAQMKTSLTPTV